MRATNALAVTPTGMLKRPRFQGPALNLLPTKKTRMKIGVVNATNAAQAPILKMAPIATGPPKISKRQRTPIAVLNHTALTGVRVYLLTCFQILERGKQSSRAYAKVTRDAT